LTAGLSEKVIVEMEARDVSSNSSVLKKSGSGEGSNLFHAVHAWPLGGAHAPVTTGEGGELGVDAVSVVSGLKSSSEYSDAGEWSPYV
jgi:hypothetical protein